VKGWPDGPCPEPSPRETHDTTVVGGWLKDRYGLSWQIVPAILPKLLAGADRGRVQRMMDALMGMTKIDIRALEAAADAA